jgi:TRAP-type C4-dicarboxylate transport system permease small subunit
MMHALKILDSAMGWFLKGVTVLMFVVLFILLTGNVFFRWVPLMSMGWFDEIVQLCFAYMVFIGSAAIWRDRDHFKIEWIESKLRDRPAGEAIRMFVDVMSLVFFLYLAYFGWSLVGRTTDLTPIFQFPRRVLYICVPFSGTVMAAYAIRDVVLHGKKMLRARAR